MGRPRGATNRTAREIKANGNHQIEKARLMEQKDALKREKEALKKQNEALKKQLASSK